MGDSSRKIVEDLIGQDAFFLVNKKLFRALDGDCTVAIALGELISLSRYYYNRTEKDWFFLTVNALEDTLLMNKYTQRRVLQFLEERGLIETQNWGSPPKRHIRVNHELIYQIIATGRPPVVVSMSREEKLQAKKNFYQRLNENMDGTYSDAIRYFGNIPISIGMFLYAWSQLDQAYFPESWGMRWEWDSRSYGILADYWKQVYSRRKQFDYDTLLSYFKQAAKLGKRDIPSFIEYDRRSEERHPNDKMTFDQLCSAIEEGEI